MLPGNLIECRVTNAHLLCWIAALCRSFTQQRTNHKRLSQPLPWLLTRTNTPHSLARSLTHSLTTNPNTAGMGGAYLTLLNTIANMGVILPKTPLFAAMDWLTFSQCHDKGGLLVKHLACPKKIRLLAGSSPCTDAGKSAGLGASCGRGPRSFWCLIMSCEACRRLLADSSGSVQLRHVPFLLFSTLR